MVGMARAGLFDAPGPPEEAIVAWKPIPEPEKPASVPEAKSVDPLPVVAALPMEEPEVRVVEIHKPKPIPFYTGPTPAWWKETPRQIEWPED